MQLSSKKNIRIILILLLQCTGYLSAFATGGLTKPLLGSQGQVKVNAVSSLSVPASTVAVTQTYLIQNMVSVGIEEGTSTYIQSDFSVTVALEITRFGVNGNQLSDSTKNFTINYSKVDGAKYNSIQYYPFQNAYKVVVTVKSITPSTGVTWDVTKVLRIDNTVTVIRDYNFQCTTPVTGLTVNLDVPNQELTAQWNPFNTGETQYDIEWSWIDSSAIQNYQTGGNYYPNLIFTNNATRVTINSQYTSYNIPLLYDGGGLLFVRVRPTQLQHTGLLVEGTWTTPVPFPFGGHQNNLNWQASTSFAEEGKRKSVVQYFDGSLRSRQTVTKDNTTNTTIVAESFYDYQGRPVIQVLPAPTLSTILQYSTSFNQSADYAQYPGYPKWEYDKLQPNASVCGNPATPLSTVSGAANYYSPNNPTVSPTATNPSTAYNANNYIPTSEGPTSGQAFPFTETRFAPDGRLSAQGGVGYMHQLGSDHETKYLYEPPAQEELDALFGTDAGDAAHYFKNIVKDANGQYSVSYTDMHGRTIATALAGDAPTQLDQLKSYKPVNFTQELLDNETNNVQGTSIISTKTIVVEKGGQTYLFNYQLNPQQLSLLTCADTNICYDCLYNLKITITSDCNEVQGFPRVFTDSNFTVGQQLDSPICNANGNTTTHFSDNFPVTFPEGSYTITKVLTLSDSAKTAYKSVFMKNDTCRTFQSFYDTALQTLTAQSTCNMTCASCKAAIGGDITGFVNNYILEMNTPHQGMTMPLTPAQQKLVLSTDILAQLQASYNEALASCNIICNGNNADGMDEIRSIEQQMLMDVTPPNGQYANPDSANKQFNIFNPYAPQYHRINLSYIEAYPSPQVSSRPAYLHPIQYVDGDATPPYGNYYDANGEIANPLGFVAPKDNYTNTPLGFYPDPTPPPVAPSPTKSSITPQQFSDLFESSWAMELLPYHPEFCKLKNSLEQLPSSYQYEATLNGIAKFSDAAAYLGVSVNSVSHQNAINIINSDPFFTDPSRSSYTTLMLAKMSVYIKKPTSFSGMPATCVVQPFSASMWQVAQATVMTQNIKDSCDQLKALLNTPANPPAEGVDCSQDWDMAWTTFRSMYLSERKELIAQYLNDQCNKVSNQNLDPGVHRILVPVNDNTPDAIINDPVNYYQVRFVDFSNLNYANLGVASDESDFLTQVSSGSSSAYASAKTLAANNQYDSACAGYTGNWISELEQCPAVGTISGSDSIWLVSHLENICNGGSDSNHIAGSSSLMPGYAPPLADSTGTYYQSFSDVIDTFFIRKKIAISDVCYPQLITQPSSFGTVQALINEPIITKPDSCECKRISSLKAEYTAAKYNGTFPDYLLYEYGAQISQGAVDSLLNLCFNPTCNFLSVPIILPVAFQCQSNPPTTKPCISCYDMENLRDSFYVEFNQHAPIIAPQTQNDTALNIAFQHFANNKTGFYKTWSDYTAFLDTCYQTSGITDTTGNTASIIPGTAGTSATSGSGATNGINNINDITVSSIDTCNCKQYAQVYNSAVAAGYNGSSLSSLNQYFKTTYGDTLSQGIYDGLQHCSGLAKIIPGGNLVTDTVTKTFYATTSVIIGSHFVAGNFATADTSTDKIIGVTGDDFSTANPNAVNTFFRFDSVATIPTSATLIAANMHLYADPDGYDPPQWTNIDAPLASAVDTAMFYLLVPTLQWDKNSDPTSLVQNASSQSYLSSQTAIITSPQDLILDALNDVHSWITEGAKSGGYETFVALKNAIGTTIPPSADSIAYATFCSNKYPDPTKRPILTVTYSFQTTSPPDTTSAYYTLPQSQLLPSFLQCVPIVTTIDTCNCKQYAQVYNRAIAAGYSGTSLSSLNQYFKSTYGDTLSQGMYDGLQHCSDIGKIIAGGPVTDTVTKTYYATSSVIVNDEVNSPHSESVDTTTDELIAATPANSNNYPYFTSTYFKFDSVSTIPSGANIYSAEMNLYADPNGFDPPLYPNAHSVVPSAPTQMLPSIWYGNGWNWNETSTAAAIQAHTSNFSFNVAALVTSAFQDFSINALQAVSFWRSGNGNTGFGLQANFSVAPVAGDGDTLMYVTFCSNKYPDPTKRPTLIVTYSYNTTAAPDTITYYTLPQSQPLPSFLQCGYQPPFNCSKASQILTNYQNLYIDPTSGYVDLSMRTFAGNKTPDEGPKGVFDANKILIGNTASGTLTQIDTSYARIWNSSSIDQAIGTLSYPSPAGSGLFRLTLKPGQQAPCDGVIGMRYYQLDVAGSTLNRLRVGPSCYVDFGDTVKINIDSAIGANSFINVYNSTIVKSPFILGQYSVNFGYNKKSLVLDQAYIIEHNYVSPINRTVTVYHPDVDGVFGFWDLNSNGTNFPLTNLRGYMPQQTFDFDFEYTSDSLLNTQSIANFNQVNSILGVEMYLNKEDSKPTNYFSSFVNNNNLRYILYFSVPQTNALVERFNSFFPDLKDNFKKLTGLESDMSNLQATGTSSIDFSVPSIAFLELDDVIPTSALIDSIFIQVARSSVDSGLIEGGGFVNSAPPRTSLSDAAYNSLASRGWQLPYSTYQAHPLTIDTLLLQDSTPVTNAFTDYYNQQQGTNYSYHQLAASYQQCGASLDICSIPTTCSQLSQSLTNYKNQFLNPENSYVDLSMRTFAGNKTPDEGPKGVFDANDSIIGNTVSGTLQQINSSYARIWNSSAADQAIGTLSYPSPAGNNLFRLTLNPGQSAPCNGIVGMRYYQFDAPVDTLDATLVGIDCYIDFGDGNKESIYSGLNARGTDVFTVNYNAYSLGNWTNSDSSLEYYYPIHYYKDKTVKTVTVYHPDVQGVFGFDNWVVARPLQLSQLSNLRGYMPQQTIFFVFHSTQNTTLNTTQNIVNFNEVNSIAGVDLGNGSGVATDSRDDVGSPSYITALNSTNFSSFANNHNIRTIHFATGNYPQYAHQSFDALFPDLKDNFKNLGEVQFNNYLGEYTNDIDFSFPKIDVLGIDAGNLSSVQIDSLIIQTSRTSQDSGYLAILNESSVRTSASDAAYNLLLSKKWTLLGAGMNISNAIKSNASLPLRDSTPLTNAFTDYYNLQNRTNFSYHQLAALYQQCGTPLDLCTPLPVVYGPMLCGLNEPVAMAVDGTPADPCQELSTQAYAAALDEWQLYTDSISNVFDTAYYNKCMGVKNLESFNVNYTTSEYGYTLYYYDQAGNLVRTIPPAGVDVSKFAWANMYKDSVNFAQANGQTLLPTHLMPTDYRYNTLNQVVQQETPDAGISKFWYDQLGRLVVSQNAKQADPTQTGGPRYSYTLYDPLGRIIEVGQKPNAAGSMTELISRDPVALNGWLTSGAAKEQITSTVYDVPYPGIAMSANGISGLYQTNLRNRVSYSVFYNSGNDMRPGGVLGGQASATFYSYDIEGNVDTLLQDYGPTGLMEQTNNRYKKIVYDYDLISGKVNQVSYQPDMADQFYHRYEYDAENRITAVLTSHDSLIWERDARYSYYKHGPLARTIIGEQQVQGIDYAYTLQGWLKGVNTLTGIGATPCPGNNTPDNLDVPLRSDYGMPSIYTAKTSITFDPGFSSSSGTGDYFQTNLDPNPVPCTATGLPSGTPVADMGGDGVVGGSNANIAQDAYSYNLNYFGGDYQPVNLPQPNNYVQAAELPLSNTGRDLYNGNISSMSVNIPKLGNAQLYGYRYDQLNRIVAMDAFTGLNTTTNLWTPVSTQDYQERIEYDPNGNILGYKRNGAQAASGLAMDSLRYFYNYYKADAITIGTYVPGQPIPAGMTRLTNQLNYVHDEAGGTYTDDIKNQSVNNYTYDAIGNLTSDYNGGIQTISWTVYGKINTITKLDGTVINYTYDATGNRISKTVQNPPAKNNTVISTFYVRDATGSVMSIYSVDPLLNGGQITQSETDLYGSGRLGIFNVNRNVNKLASANYTSTINTFIRGNKSFELDNHLGNVLVTVSDKELQHSSDNSTVDYNIADVVTANDYYPFGMLQPGRQFTQSNSSYRYSFNGQEKSNEIAPNTTTAEYWEYDSRIGRRWNTDPKPIVGISDYSAFSNNPILHMDALGDSGTLPITSAGATTTYAFRLNAANKYQAFSRANNQPYNPATGSAAQNAAVNNATTEYNLLANNPDKTVHNRFIEMNADKIDHNITSNALTPGASLRPAVQADAAGNITATNTFLNATNPGEIIADLITKDAAGYSIGNGNSNQKATFAGDYLSTTYFNSGAKRGVLNQSNTNANGYFNQQTQTIVWIPGVTSTIASGGQTLYAQTALQYADKAYIENKVLGQMGFPQRQYFVAPLLQGTRSGRSDLFYFYDAKGRPARGIMESGIFKYTGTHL